VWNPHVRLVPKCADDYGIYPTMLDTTLHPWYNMRAGMTGLDREG